MRSGQLIYFSPTHTTSRVLQNIAKGLGGPMRLLDITHAPLSAAMVGQQLPWWFMVIEPTKMHSWSCRRCLPPKDFRSLQPQPLLVSTHFPARNSPYPPTGRIMKTWPRLNPWAKPLPPNWNKGAMTTHSRYLVIFRTRNAAPPRASFPKRIANSAVTVVLVSVPVRLAPSRRMILHSQMQTSASVAPPVSRAVLQLPARLRTRPCSRLSRRFSKIASFVASQNGICDAIVRATYDLHRQSLAADGGSGPIAYPLELVKHGPNTT